MASTWMPLKNFKHNSWVPTSHPRVTLSILYPMPWEIDEAKKNKKTHLGPGTLHQHNQPEEDLHLCGGETSNYSFWLSLLTTTALSARYCDVLFIIVYLSLCHLYKEVCKLERNKSATCMSHDKVLLSWMYSQLICKYTKYHKIISTWYAQNHTVHELYRM